MSRARGFIGVPRRTAISKLCARCHSNPDIMRKYNAAVPQLQYVERMLEIVSEVVEQNVADTSAEDDPKRGVENEVVGMASRHRRARLADQLQEVPVADEDAGEICEAVPTELEEP
jgi:hypothetical protein